MLASHFKLGQVNFDKSNPHVTWSYYSLKCLLLTCPERADVQEDKCFPGTVTDKPRAKVKITLEF